MSLETPRELGRYVLYDQIAAGGMATVHFARMHGAIGFSRLVAIKRLHPNYASDADCVQMFLDEARLAARLDHPNVVSTLDVVRDDAEVFLVMEHILGEALEALMPRAGTEPIPLRIVSAIVCGVLEGLHAAHQARSDTGEPLTIVHRDVSPHNILVGVDGVARVFDFGVAKAAINTQETREGVIKGKVTYMAPEQVWGLADRRADLYATGVILWELIAGRRRHAGASNDALFLKLAKNELEPLRRLSAMRMDVPVSIDAIVARATAPAPAHRFDTAREMAVALEAAVPPAPAREVTEWIRAVAGARIERTASVIRRIESQPPASEPTNEAPSPSTGSIVVTSTLPRPETGTMTISPSLAPEIRPSQRPTMSPPRTSWTIPATLLAFTAVVLLAVLRTLSRHDAPTAGASVDAAMDRRPSAVASKTSRVSETEPRGSASAPPLVATTPSGAPSASEEARHPHAGTGGSAAPPSRPAWVATPPAPRPPSRELASPTSARAEPGASMTASHKAGCESPFSIGADGIRQIKPECL